MGPPLFWVNEMSACNMVKNPSKGRFIRIAIKKKLRLVKTVIPGLKEPLR